MTAAARRDAPGSLSDIGARLEVAEEAHARVERKLEQIQRMLHEVLDMATQVHQECGELLRRVEKLEHLAGLVELGGTQ